MIYFNQILKTSDQQDRKEKMFFKRDGSIQSSLTMIVPAGIKTGSISINQKLKLFQSRLINEFSNDLNSKDLNDRIDKIMKFTNLKYTDKDCYRKLMKTKLV
jgi:hypothetical protein